MSTPKMELRVLYRASDDMTEPKEVMGTGYPDNDSDGVPIYENTHYVKLEWAWDGLMRQRAAHVSLVGSGVAECKRQLRKAEGEAGRAAELFMLATRAHDAWKRKS